MRLGGVLTGLEKVFFDGCRKASPALFAAAVSTGCGARSSLYAPPEPERTGRPSYCSGMEAPPIYVVTEDFALLRFDPPSKTFDPIGMLDCPLGGSGVPWSMAVGHDGTAYILTDVDEWFRVNTANASCTDEGPVPYTVDNAAMTGMSFVADADGVSETLFAIGDLGGLDTLDPMTLQSQTVGTLSTDIGGAALTGTPDGRFFAFGVGPGESGTVQFVGINPVDAAVVSDQMVMPAATPTYLLGNAVAFWGGDFYFITMTANEDEVFLVLDCPAPHRRRLLRPELCHAPRSDDHGRELLDVRSVVTSHDLLVRAQPVRLSYATDATGAGASTCDPQGTASIQFTAMKRPLTSPT